MGINPAHAAGPTEVLRYVASPITTPLTNTAEFAHPEDRYSFSFDGNAQSLDHMVVNQAVLDGFIGVRAEHARINADFGIDNYGDATVPVRVSDHDPVVLFLGEASFRSADLSISLWSDTEILQITPARFNATVSNSGPDTATGVKVDFAISMPAAIFDMTPPAGWTCGQPQPDGGTGFLVHCNADEFAAGETVVFQATVLNGWQAGTTANIGAAIASAATDANTTNNSASSQIRVVAGTDLSVRLIEPKGGLKINQPARYVVEFNTSPVFDAEDVVFEAQINLPMASLTVVPLGNGPLQGCTITEDLGNIEPYPEYVSTVRCTAAAIYPAGSSNALQIDLTPRTIHGNSFVVVMGNVLPGHLDSNLYNNSVSSALFVKGYDLPDPTPAPVPMD